MRFHLLSLSFSLFFIITGGSLLGPVKARPEASFIEETSHAPTDEAPPLGRPAALLCLLLLLSTSAEVDSTETETPLRDPAVCSISRLPSPDPSLSIKAEHQPLSLPAFDLLLGQPSFFHTLATWQFFLSGTA